MSTPDRLYHMTYHPLITRDQIVQFSTEAAEAGDLEAVAICQRALNQLEPWADTPRQFRIDNQAAVERALQMSVAEARERVAQWRADAGAMHELTEAETDG